MSAGSSVQPSRRRPYRAVAAGVLAAAAGAALIWGLVWGYVSVKWNEASAALEDGFRIEGVLPGAAAGADAEGLEGPAPATGRFVVEAASVGALRGLRDVALEGVHAQWTGPSGETAVFRADEVVVTISPLRLLAGGGWADRAAAAGSRSDGLMRRLLGAVSRVRLQDAEIGGPQGGLAFSGEAVIDASLGALQVRRAEFELGEGGRLAMSGAIGGPLLDLDLALFGADLRWLASFMGGDGGSGRWAGRADFTGRLEGSWRAPVLEGELAGSAWMAALGEDVYAVDRIEGPLRLERGWLRSSGLRLERAGRRVWVSGGWELSQGVHGALQADVYAEEIKAPDDVPALASLGMEFPARFEGELSGSLADPALHGHLRLGEGLLWHAPMNWANGLIELDRRGLRFWDATVAEGDARYRLRGEVHFEAPDRPGGLDIELATDAGRIEHLLPAAGAAGAGLADLDGMWSGRMAFQGAFGDVRTVVDMDLGAGTLYGQGFDAGRARLEWGAGGIDVYEVELLAAGGRGGVRGKIDSHGGVDLVLETRDLPLHLAASVLARHAAGRGGSFELGPAKSALDENALSGRLTAERVRAQGRWPAIQLDGDWRLTHMRAGSLRLDEAAGRATIHASGRVELSDVVALMPGGGRYTVNGDVELSAGEPWLDLRVQVAGERLSRVLQWAPARLPAEYAAGVLDLFAGEVTGEIVVEGFAMDPRAQLDLTWAEPSAPEDGFRLALEYADGRLRLRS